MPWPSVLRPHASPPTGTRFFRLTHSLRTLFTIRSHSLHLVEMRGIPSRWEKHVITSLRSPGRVAVGGAAALVAGLLAMAGTSSASAASEYYKAPYPDDESYLVTQGPEGTYSHVGLYNEYAWDFGLPANYEVSAAQGGRIVISDWSPYWENGIEVIISHDNGECTHYAHLNRALYDTGDYVPQGRVIGWSGETGAAHGAHLHFQAIDCATRIGLPSTIEGWTPWTGAWPVSSNKRR